MTEIYAGYFVSHKEQCPIDSATVPSLDLLKSIISNSSLDKSNGVSLKMAFSPKFRDVGPPEGWKFLVLWCPSWYLLVNPTGVFRGL